MTSPPLPWTELAEHSRGLSRLAASLLSDFHGGEDLAQEAVLRALVARPSSSQVPSSTAWLRVTVRRLAANEWRGRARRSQREEAVARPEAVPSSEEVLERAEVSRKVLDALDDLPEPYARTLRDHYIGGLAADQMAERDGLSIHTVRSRIHRGKAALRASLESASDLEGTHWSLALAPLAVPGLSARATTLVAATSGLTSTLGVVTLMKKFAFVAACVVAGFFGLKAVTSAPVPSSPATETAGIEPTEIEPLGPVLQPPSTVVEENRTEAQVGVVQTTSEPPSTTVTGQVVDSSQAPLEGVHVTWEGHAWIDRERALMRSVSATTGADGRYSVGLPYEPDSFWTAEFRGKPFQTNASLRASVRESADLPVLVPGPIEAPTVTLGPAGAARGRVVDELGEPIADALVRLAPGKGESSYGLLPESETSSGADGQFFLGHVALGALGVAISADECTVTYLSGLAFEHESTIELGDIPLGESKHIAGTIVDEDGDPVEGQTVRTWSLEEHNVGTLAETDANGCFDLVLSSNAPQRLSIEREGYASIGGFGFEPLTVEPGTRDLRFQLEPLPSMTFRVVDAEGEPIEQFRLSLVLGGGSEATHSVHSSGGPTSQRPHPGGLEVRTARAGQDLVRVFSTGYLPFQSDVESDLGSTGEQTIQLSLGATLMGRVMHADEPAAGATVTSTSGSWRSREMELTAEADEEGRYVLRGLGPGGVSVTAQSADGTLTGAMRVQVDKSRFVSPGQAPEVTVDDLQLQGRGSIEGTVSLPSGVGPEGLEVYVGDWGDAKRFPLRPDGSFRIPDLEAGAHRVSLTERPGAIDKVRSGPVVVREGEVRTVHLDARQYGISRLDLTMEVPGYAPEDVSVRVMHGLLDPKGHPGTRGGSLPTCDSEGRLTLWPRASGVAHLELHLPDAWTTLIEPEINLTAGSVVRQHVIVALGSLEVELPSGLDLQGAGGGQFTLFRPGISHSLANWQIATTGESNWHSVKVSEGVCTLHPVQAGSFQLRLQVRDQGYQVLHTATVPVTIEGGVTARVSFPALESPSASGR